MDGEIREQRNDQINNKIDGRMNKQKGMKDREGREREKAGEEDGQ